MISLITLILSAILSLGSAFVSHNQLVREIESGQKKQNEKTEQVKSDIQDLQSLVDLQGKKLGSFTTVNSTDQQSAFPAVYNANLTETYREINSTTTLPNLISAASLATVGTITSGTWNASTITVPYGGTGSTTLAQFQILLGSSTNPFGIVKGVGTSGQSLQSQGAGLPPQWAANTTDQSANYAWTGTHSFAASSTISGGFNPFVGVGTTSPYGTFAIEGTSTTPPLIIGDKGTTTPVLRVDNGGTTTIGAFFLAPVLTAKAFYTTGQAAIVGTSTIAFNNVEFDTGKPKMYDGSTKMTVPFDGYYRVDNRLLFQIDNNTGITCGTGIQKNGGAVIARSHQIGETITKTLNPIYINEVIRLAANDYVEVIASCDNSSGGTVITNRGTENIFGLTFIGK